MSGPHLVLDISPHGFGHLAQTSMVIDALRRRRPDLRLTLRCGHSDDVVLRFIPPPWNRAAAPPELGMAMTSPNDVDVPASLAFYRRLHAGWEDLVRTEGASLADLRPDLLVTNVGYVGLAAAQARGIPSVSMCSLNWFDVASAYLADEAGAADVLQQMHAAYAGARAFIRMEPALPMAGLVNRRTVGPVARLGTRRRDALLGRRPGTRSIILVSFGGLSGGSPLTRVPRLDSTLWLVSDPALVEPGRPDILHADSMGLPFPDLIRSSDLVLTKPGYGMFAEAICNGTRLLYLERPDWPETAGMAAWAARFGVASAIASTRLNGPALDQAIATLLARPLAPPPAPTGGEEAAAIIDEFLPPR